MATIQAGLTRWTDDDLRALCRRNDANGDWDDASRDELVETILRWQTEEPDYWRAVLSASGA